MKVKFLHVFVLFGVLALAGVAYMFFRTESGFEFGTKDTELATVNQEGYFKSNTENVQFQLPAGWHEVSNDSVSLPKAITNPLVLFVKDGTQCAIAYGDIDLGKNVGEQADTYRHMSFADRIFSPAWQWDGGWYVPVEFVPKDFKFSFEGGRLYTKGEIRVSSSGRVKRMELFNVDGSSVADECNTDLNKILSTATYYFEPIRLTQLSAGRLQVLSTRDDRGGDAVVRIVFTDEKTSERREVVVLPKGTDWTGSYFVSGRSLYFLVREYTPPVLDESKKPLTPARFNSAVYIVDVFSGEIKRISQLVFEDKYISSFYVNTSAIYLTVGSSELASCMDGYKPCYADFYKASFPDVTPQLVADTVLSSILGYVPKENMFYFSNSWGDAGCGSYTFQKLQNGEKTDLGKYGGCYTADDQIEPGLKAGKTLNETFNQKPEKIFARGMLVSGGVLSPDMTETEGYDGAYYFDK